MTRLRTFKRARATGYKVERVLAVDEFGNESWVPLEQLANGGEAFRQAAAASRTVRQPALQVEVAPEPVQELAGERDETRQEGPDEPQEQGGPVMPVAQQSRSFWLTNAGAGCVFVLLWIGASIFGSFCRVFGPDVMIVGYIVGVFGWWIGYFVWLAHCWYPGQPWQVVTATVQVAAKDKKGREKVDRNGRLVVNEEERPVTKQVNGRLYVRAWRPWKETWVLAELLGVREGENVASPDDTD